MDNTHVYWQHCLCGWFQALAHIFKHLISYNTCSWLTYLRPATHFRLHLNPLYHFQLFFSPPQPSSILFQSLSILCYVFFMPFNYFQLLPPPSPSVPGSDLDPFLFGDHDDGPRKFFLSLYSLFLHDCGLFALPFVFPPPTLIPTLPIWDCAMSLHHHGYYGPLFLQCFPLIGYPQSVPSPPSSFFGVLYLWPWHFRPCLYLHIIIFPLGTIQPSIRVLCNSLFPSLGFMQPSVWVLCNSLFSPWVLYNPVFLPWVLCNPPFEFFATCYFLFFLGFMQPVILSLAVYKPFIWVLCNSLFIFFGFCATCYLFI